MRAQVTICPGQKVEDQSRRLREVPFQDHIKESAWSRKKRSRTIRNRSNFQICRTVDGFDLACAEEHAQKLCNKLGVKALTVL